MQATSASSIRDGDSGYEAIKLASRAVPTIVAVDLDRPAILTNVKRRAQAIIATFGASDAAVLERKWTHTPVSIELVSAAGV